MGAPKEQILVVLSKVLPNTVDQLTPEGRLPTRQEIRVSYGLGPEQNLFFFKVHVEEKNHDQVKAGRGAVFIITLPIPKPATQLDTAA